MKQELDELVEQAQADIESGDGEKTLEEIRIRYLGKKGSLAGLFKRLGELDKQERPAFGLILNEAKNDLEGRLNAALQKAKDRALVGKLAEEKIDVSLPGRPLMMGRRHILTQVTRQIEEIFTVLGFSVAEGPDVESDYYNFEALNFPPDHPAREEHDTFFVEGGHLLRTHTSPVQIRTMEKQQPPVRVICPGSCYRNDVFDATHSPMFHQVEGFMVGEGITFGDLKGVLTHFCRKMFGEDQKVRFRAGFFPFTEPSAEVDVQCVFCGGDGCSVCKQTGWLEILGSGMIDPNVFEFVKYDSEKYTGFAFGMGIERIAMLKYGVDDIRLFFENDMRFLSQF